MFQRVAEQTYLIFGGTSGIGLATAQLLAAQGARVAVCSRSAEKLEAVASSIAQPIVCLQGDIAHPQDCVDVLAQLHKQWGVVDVVINAAGVHAPRRQFTELTTEDAEGIFSVNAVGVFNALKASHGIFLKQGYGHYIQVSSAASDRPSVLAGCAYTGSKHAVNGMLKTVAQEVGGDNVRISIVSPGPTETPLVDTRKEPATDEQRSKMLRAETVAECTVFTALMPREAYVEHMMVLPSGQQRVEPSIA